MNELYGLFDRVNTLEMRLTPIFGSIGFCFFWFLHKFNAHVGAEIGVGIAIESNLSLLDV